MDQRVEQAIDNILSAAIDEGCNLCKSNVAASSMTPLLLLSSAYKYYYKVIEKDGGDSKESQLLSNLYKLVMASSGLSSLIKNAEPLMNCEDGEYSDVPSIAMLDCFYDSVRKISAMPTGMAEDMLKEMIEKPEGDNA